MKVLIYLAFVGYTLASDTPILTEIVQPAVAAVEVIPSAKTTSYEYSADVHTSDYKTHQSVKSSDLGVIPVATVVAPQPQVIQTVPVLAKAQPIITVEQPIVTIAQPVLQREKIVNVVEAAPLVKTEILPAEAKLVAQPIFVKSAPLVKPIVETIIEPKAVVATAIVADKVQYHSQDSLGQAAYGHSEALQTHNAIQDITGSKAGSFSYVAPDGRLLTTDYVADENGYRVASNALPVRRRRSLAYSAPILTTGTYLPYAYHANYPSRIYAPGFYAAAPLVAVKGATATSTLINHGDGFSHTYRVD